MSSWSPTHAAQDYPPLSVRWEGLVVVLDATTLNTALRKVMLRVPDVKGILVEPDDGRLGLTISLKKKRVRLPLRSHLGSIRLKDGFLGFHVEDLTVFGFLPILYGNRKAVAIISPFFVLPWLLLAALAFAPDPFAPGQTLLTGNSRLLALLGLGLAAWGVYTVRLLSRNPEELSTTENHPSWTHMYLMMMTAQIGFAAAYLI